MAVARPAGDRGERADAPPPRRSHHARPSIFSRDFAPGAAILGGQVGFRAAGAPWWTLCLLTAFGLATVCLHIVFPQNSSDKVAWWSERWKSRRHCQCQAGPSVTERDEMISSSTPPGQTAVVTRPLPVRHGSGSKPN